MKLDGTAAVKLKEELEALGARDCKLLVRVLVACTLDGQSYADQMDFDLMDHDTEMTVEFLGAGLLDSLKGGC